MTPLPPIPPSQGPQRPSSSERSILHTTNQHIYMIAPPLIMNSAGSGPISPFLPTHVHNPAPFAPAPLETETNKGLLRRFSDLTSQVVSDIEILIEKGGPNKSWELNKKLSEYRGEAKKLHGLMTDIRHQKLVNGFKGVAIRLFKETIANSASTITPTQNVAAREAVFSSMANRGQSAALAPAAPSPVGHWNEATTPNTSSLSFASPDSRPLSPITRPPSPGPATFRFSPAPLEPFSQPIGAFSSSAGSGSTPFTRNPIPGRGWGAGPTGAPVDASSMANRGQSAALAPAAPSPVGHWNEAATPNTSSLSFASPYPRPVFTIRRPPSPGPATFPPRASSPEVLSCQMGDSSSLAKSSLSLFTRNPEGHFNPFAFLCILREFVPPTINGMKTTTELVGGTQNFSNLRNSPTQIREFTCEAQKLKGEIDQAEVEYQIQAWKNLIIDPEKTAADRKSSLGYYKVFQSAMGRFLDQKNMPKSIELKTTLNTDGIDVLNWAENRSVSSSSNTVAPLPATEPFASPFSDQQAFGSLPSSSSSSSTSPTLSGTKRKDNDSTSSSNKKNKGKNDPFQKAKNYIATTLENISKKESVIAIRRSLTTLQAVLGSNMRQLNEEQKKYIQLESNKAKTEIYARIASQQFVKLTNLDEAEEESDKVIEKLEQITKYKNSRYILRSAEELINQMPDSKVETLKTAYQKAVEALKQKKALKASRPRSDQVEDEADDERASDPIGSLPTPSMNSPFEDPSFSSPVEYDTSLSSLKNYLSPGPQSDPMLPLDQDPL